MNFLSQKTRQITSLSTNLPERLRMLDNLLDNLDGMVYRCIYDECWTMMFVSEGCKNLTGYSPQDILFNTSISYKNLIHEDYLDLVQSATHAAVKNSQRFEIEYCIRKQDGSVRWVLERGNPVYNQQGEIEALEGFIEDISSRVNIEKTLRQTEERYRSIFENAIEGIFQTSPSGQYLVVNPALARIYGYSSPEELIDALNNIQEQLYVSHERRQEFVNAMSANGSVHNFESLVYRKDKSTIWISENARMVFDDNGGLLYYEGTVEDITERKTYEQKIEHQATHDGLTGLPNRHMLNDRLQQCMTFADHYKNKFAVAFLDLDQFKLINDSMGHEIGDQ